jgi:hypothetical protein
MTRLASALVLLTGAALSGGDLPAVAGTERVLEGEVRVNLTPARFAISVGAAPALATLDAAAQAAGWRPGPERRVLPTPGGTLDLRSYRDGERWLMQGSVAGAGADPGVIVQAVFAGVPRWAAGIDGARNGDEAPGREPAGWPRLAAARRILHLEGRGFEAACYSTPAPPSAVLAEAVRRLAGQGWRVEPLGGRGMFAVRSGRPDTALWTRPEYGGTVFVVIATREVR